jgi:pimeloyl-ACP methyl ester carboxylesterase
MGCGGSKEIVFHKIPHKEYGLNLNPTNIGVFKRCEKSILLENGETYSYYDIDSYSIFRLDKFSVIPILILHDFSYSKEIFKTLIEKLIKVGFRCIVPDLRGHGKTTYKTTVNSLNDYIDDIKNLSDLIGIKKYHGIIGWSFGGAIALKISIDLPDYLNKLVLINSIPVQGLKINFNFDSNEKENKERDTENKESDKESDKENRENDKENDKENKENYKENKENNKQNDKQNDKETNSKLITKEMIRNYSDIKILMNFINEGCTNSNYIKIKEFFYKGDFNQNGKPTDETLFNLTNSLIEFKCPIDAFFLMANFNISDDNTFTEGTNEINKIKIPILLLHGKKDCKINLQLKYDEIELLDKNQINYENYFYENGGHFVLCDDFHIIIKKIKFFLKC